MAGRSLRASAEGIERARTAYKRDGWTQEELKSELGLKTRQPITRFLAGHPIERHTFIDLCRLLGLEVEEIAESESVEKKQGSEVDIDALVQEIREKVKPNIRERCGTMRVLDMTQPIELTGELCVKLDCFTIFSQCCWVKNIFHGSRSRLTLANPSSPGIG